MAKQKVQTPKGFRDFLPEQAKTRGFVMGNLTDVFERFGFEPLETPAVEFSETLKGKYGDEEKLIFEFTDRGGRSVGLRYDQTVPLARVVASNPGLPRPFKRYQVQPVWRAENPQKGRFREFIQADFDIIGSDSLLADCEIINTAVTATKKIGFDKFVLKINDRENFNGLQTEVIRTIDKLDKIGEAEVIEQLTKFGYDKRQAKSLFKKIKDSPPTKNIRRLFDLLELSNLDKDKYAYDPTLARGLDYYTGVIYELEIEGYQSGSVGSGGRYDDLIGKLSGGKTPSVGFSFGIDRLVESAQELNTLTFPEAITKILVTVFNEKFLKESLDLAEKLRNSGINTEVFLNFEEKLDKQIKYADSKNIPFVAILGPDETKEDKFTLKNLSTGSQSLLTFSELKKQLN